MNQGPDKEEILQFGDFIYEFENIREVIDVFYRKVEKDELLSVPFSSVTNWPKHIESLTHFWWMRLGGSPYLPLNYNPIEKHYLAGFDQTFLSRWLMLFHEVLEDKLDEKQADYWRDLSVQMGRGLSAGNEMYKKRFG